ncbi:hypothetical protein CK222_03920 [Mesorhizobium sp. WSM3866]|nr:hypothetical protein CK214_24900 [Mesorhizobium sp. WSM3882]PBB45617.1 hypothetical protein CK222_03920 [Mesorhizobium sp. WSM3866]
MKVKRDFLHWDSASGTITLFSPHSLSPKLLRCSKQLVLAIFLLAMAQFGGIRSAALELLRLHACQPV